MSTTQPQKTSDPVHPSGSPIFDRANAFLAFTRGDTPDTFATVTTFLAILCLHVGLRHFHLGFRFDEPAFFISGAINLVAAAGTFSARRTEALRYSPVLLAISVAIFAYWKPGLGNHALMESMLLLAIPVPIRTDRIAPITDLFC